MPPNFTGSTSPSAPSHITPAGPDPRSRRLARQPRRSRCRAGRLTASAAAQSRRRTASASATSAVAASPAPAGVERPRASALCSALSSPATSAAVERSTLEQSGPRGRNLQRRVCSSGLRRRPAGCRHRQSGRADSRGSLVRVAATPRRGRATARRIKASIRIIHSAAHDEARLPCTTSPIRIATSGPCPAAITRPRCNSRVPTCVAFAADAARRVIFLYRSDLDLAVGEHRRGSSRSPRGAGRRSNQAWRPRD